MNSPERQHEVTALVEAHYAELYRYAFRLTGKHSDAEDLTQQAFLRAQEKLDQLREQELARPWLYAIVRNSFLNAMRHDKAVRCQSLEDLDDVPTGANEPPELTGEELTSLLDGLPEEFRIPLVLFYFEELNYREIAEALDLPAGTVMSRLSRGKSYLRARLGAGRPALSAK